MARTLQERLRNYKRTCVTVLQIVVDEVAQPAHDAAMVIKEGMHMTPRRYRVIAPDGFWIACDLTQLEARAIASKRDAMRGSYTAGCRIEAQS